MERSAAHLLPTVVLFTALGLATSVHLQPHQGLSMQASGAGDKAAAPLHPWPHSMYKSSFTHIVPPRNLSAHLAFTWHHPNGRFGTVLAGGPVIDAGGNFYLAGQDAFRKLSPQGKQLWEFRPPASTNNMPALGQDVMLGNDKGGHAFALDVVTGKPRWVKRVAFAAGGDSGYPAAHKGIFIMGANPGPHGGNTRLLALNESTGKQLWEHRVDPPVWNFQPLFLEDDDSFDDDSFVFMDQTGGMFRFGLRDGRQMWGTPSTSFSSTSSFSDGGAVLGGNMAFSCSNPDHSTGSEGQPGVVRAFNLEDGSMAWERRLPQPCNSYPAYGPLAKGRAPSVVVTPGSFMGTPVMHGSVMAMDAATGEMQWQFQTTPFRNAANMARGDVEGFAQRSKGKDPYVGMMCLPAHWGAPAISGDGTVYAGRSDGFLYAIHGGNFTEGGPAPKDIDFKTSPGVTAELVDVLGCALHGSTAWAPGTMAFQTCDSLWVFKF